MKIQCVSSCAFLDATEVFDSQAMSVAAGETLNGSGGTLLLWMFLFIVAPRLRRAVTSKRPPLGRRRARRMERCTPGVLARALRQQEWCTVAERILHHAIWRYHAAQTVASYFPGQLTQAELALCFAGCLATSAALHACDARSCSAPPAGSCRRPRSSKRHCQSRSPH